jgi:hypothetical protein
MIKFSGDLEIKECRTPIVRLQRNGFHFHTLRTFHFVTGNITLDAEAEGQSHIIHVAAGTVTRYVF